MNQLSSFRAPAPEWGATGVTMGAVPILAQTYTEPFTVYSAKRFPGVPDTTALSIAFGNQGQKLPLVCLLTIHYLHSNANHRRGIVMVNDREAREREIRMMKVTLMVDSTKGFCAIFNRLFIGLFIDT